MRDGSAAGAADAPAAYLGEAADEPSRKRARRGVVRYVALVLDLSKAAGATDVRPSRAAACCATAASLVREFFDQNPLSHLSVLAMRDGACARLSELSASAESHLAAIRAVEPPSGDASLQNALHAARTALGAVPTYGLREVLMLVSTLSSCDPGDVNKEISACARAKVRASVVSLSAEMYVCRTLADKTKGKCETALDAAHFRSLALGHAKPPAALRELAPASLIQMGFPKQAAAAMGGGEGEANAVNVCPRCRAHATDLPAICATCDLTLASSLMMARSYHHLFPLPRSELAPPEALLAAGGAGRAPCTGCGEAFDGARDEVVLRRPCCGVLLCVACDVYMQTLHNCVGCLSGDGAMDGGGADGIGNGQAATAMDVGA